MRKFLSVLLSTIMLSCIFMNAITAQASTKSPIDNLTIDESLEYLRTLGYDVEIIDYNSITKSDIKELLSKINNAPKVINLTPENLKSHYEVSPNAPVTLSLSDSIQYNCMSYKEYTSDRDDNGSAWNWSVKISYTYDKYISGTSKYFYGSEFKNLSTARGTSVTGWSYSQDGNIGYTMMNQQSYASIVGKGIFTMGVGSFAVHHYVTYKTNIYP